MMAEPCTEEARIERNEDDIQRLWKESSGLREKFDLLMRKWVPVWVTIVLTLMGTITGSALTFAGMIIKFANKLK